MKLEEVTKLYQTYKWQEVNDYLAKGFKVIKIFSSKTKSADDNFEQVIPCYILGLAKEKATE